MEANQFLERFRLLSREIQLGIQTSQKRLINLRDDKSDESLNKLEISLKKIDEDWGDFAGWVLISTLDDINEAKNNCAPGLVNIRSKIIRSKIRATGQADQHGVRIDIKQAEDAEISTYIPYFEQFLDLIFLNAVKYSPRGQAVDVSCSWKDGNVILSIESIGPLVYKHEKQSLGQKSFRSENAIKSKKPGGGFGLFNFLKLAELIDADVKFNLSHRKITEIDGVEYSDFSVVVILKPS